MTGDMTKAEQAVVIFQQQLENQKLKNENRELRQVLNLLRQQRHSRPARFPHRVDTGILELRLETSG